MSSLNRNRRRRVFAVAAVLLGLGVAFLLCEIALRVYVASRGWTPNCYVTGLTFFVPHNRAGHTLRPGLRLKSSAYDISINALGLRGPEIERDKPESVTRIAVLGGSSVFGYLVPRGQDSCRQLERILKDRRFDVEVLNAGVPGFNMTQCRYRYEDEIARLRPDYVLLYLGWNDTRFLINDNAEKANKTPPPPPLLKRILSHSVLYGFVRYRLFPQTAPQFAPPSSVDVKVTAAGAAGFRQDLTLLLEAIEKSGATPIVSTQVMASGEHCDGLERFLGNSAEQIEANRRIGSWITNQMREFAQSRSLLLVDCAAEVKCNGAVLGDAIHLTKEGHARVAERWASKIIPLLTSNERQDGESTP